MPKIYRLSEISAKSFRSSVSERKARVGHRQDYELLARCREAWESKHDIRETRERVKSYTFGDQWGDIIRYKGRYISEREYIKAKGNVPLSNNIMISIQNSVVGLYAKQGSEPVCFARSHDALWLSDMMSATMQANWQDTNIPDVLKTVFQDYLIGGVACLRECYEEREGIADTWTDYCNPNFLFWEGGSDPRHQDMNIVGMLHDVSREDLYAQFAKPEYGLDIDKLNEIFGIEPAYPRDGGLQQNELNNTSNIEFSYPANRQMYRVIECWTKETKTRYQCTDPIANNADDARYRIEMEDAPRIAAENRKRKAIYDQAEIPEDERTYIQTEKIEDVFWYFTFMAPDGTVLCEGETPFEHKSHPFVMKLYPYVNGEVHPFMGNIIDQQRYINRLIVMHDMATRSSAKGITIVPKGCLGDLTPEEFADEWTEYDGMIFYDTNKLNPNLRPEIITSNAVQIGTYELLQLQLNLVRDISNVSGALQGKTPSAGTSASRYSMESQNATTSLYSLLSDMTTLTENLARKKVANIKQYYDDRRLIINRDGTDMIEYDRLAARDVMFKISIKESAASAAYNTQMNDMLGQLLQSGAINVMQYLQNVNAPFADSLLQSLQSEQLAQQQQQMQQQMTPEQMQQGDNNAAEAAQMMRQ